MMTNEAYPMSLSIEELKGATEEDSNLTRVKEALSQRQWKPFLDNAALLTAVDQSVRQQLWRVRDELSTGGDK